MRTFLPLTLLLASLLSLASCAKRIHIDQVSFRGDTVYHEGSPYTGEIWTEDEQTGCFRTEDGILRSLVFYHRNGQEAITMQVNDEGAPHTDIYDEHGQPIDMISFQTKYADIWLKMAMVQGELMMR